MNAQDRKSWAKENALTETIDMLRNLEAFDEYVKQHEASLAGKVAQTTLAATRSLLRRIDPQVLAERQKILIERRKRAAAHEDLGLKPRQCKHKRHRCEGTTMQHERLLGAAGSHLVRRADHM